MNPSHITLINQARQNALQGNTGKALEILKKLLEISRSDREVQATAYFEIGKVYTQLNKDDLALKFLKKSISTSPEVLIQEFDWFMDLERRNKKHIFKELQETQKEFKEYLIAQTKGAASRAAAGVSETAGSYVASEQASAVQTVVRIGAGYGIDGRGAFKYAGIWKRVVATIVDSIVILFVNLVVLLVLIYGFGLTFAGLFYPAKEAAFMLGGLLGLLVFYVVSIILWWLYYSIMESSRCQGTLGKMLIGIYVSDSHGRRIGIGRASGRYFLRVLLFSIPPFGTIIFYFLYISAFYVFLFYIPLLGIIDVLMVAVTDRKQAWHDMPVGCLVLSK
jgi:uncharacterized RDD family membrane protein YckC